MTKIIEFKWKPQPLLKNCKYIKEISKENEEVKNWIYKPRFEESIIEAFEIENSSIKELIFLDKNDNTIDVAIEELKKYNYVHEQRPEMCECEICKGKIKDVKNEGIEIPSQLQNPEFRFLLLRKKDKKPLELEWQKKNNYQFNDEKLLNHIKTGANYGIIGGFGKLILIDADSEEINEKCKLLPDTFKVKTGSPEEYKNHYFFISDEPLNPIRLSKEKVGDIGDIRSAGQYVVAPNSIHPSGNPYKVVKDIPISKISGAFLKSIFKDYIDTISSANKEIKNKPDYKIDTTKRLSAFTKNCKVPDYVLNNKLPDNISKNWTLFPYIIDVLNSRDVSDKLYEKLAEVQDHNIGAVKGWVKSAKEGTLAKTSCKKMREYINNYIPELSDDICSGCSLYEKIKDEEKQKREEELKNKLLEEHKEKISQDKNVNELLQNPNLFNIIIKELDKKIEKEEKSKKAITLSLCSVWVEGSEVPLNSLVSSESSSGKSFICKNIIKLFPREIVQYRTKITPEAFTYWKNDENWDWDGKICYLEDITQGILDAPTFKVMCSEGSTATIVIKQKAVDIEIQGKPVMLVTTARTNPNTEILNRFQIIGLDETKEQTKAIVLRQAQQKNNIKYDEDVTNALRLLKRKSIYIPFAEKIAEFLNQNYNFDSIRLRRDFSRLLDLIKCSAVLHQYQREEENNRIIAKEQDYQIAREIINYIQTATFKGLTHKLKKAFDCCKELKEFTASEIHSKFPICNQKMWYNYLDELLERKMIKTEVRNIEGIKSDGKRYVVKTTFYMVQTEKNFELPEFDELPQNITNDTNDTNDTKGTTDCNDCNDCFDKLQEKTKKTPEIKCPEFKEKEQC